MGIKYKLEIEASEGDTRTETEYETSNLDDLRRFLDLAGVPYEQAEQAAYQEPEQPLAYDHPEDEMVEDYFAPDTYDFTDEDYDDEYVTTSDLDPYAEDDVYEAIEPGSTAWQVKHWLNKNHYFIKYKDKGKTGRSFKLKTWAVHKDEKPSNPKSEGAHKAIEYKEKLEDEIKKEFPGVKVKLTKTWAPGGANDMWSVRVHIPNDEQMTEDTEDRDGADYDYGHHDARGQRGRVKRGDAQIDAYGYKGREEAEGTDQRLVNNYGNNAMRARMKEEEELDEEGCGCGGGHHGGCQCPACAGAEDSDDEYVVVAMENEGEEPPYSYEIDSMGNVTIYNNDTGESVFLQGDEANEVIAQVEQAAEDERTQQIVLRQYEHLMEDAETTLFKRLSEQYRKMYRE